MKAQHSWEYCSEEVFMKQVFKHSIAQLVTVFVLIGATSLCV